MSDIHTITQRLTRFTAVLLLAVWQAVFAFSPLIYSSVVHAAPVCVVDTAGANDEPGQKDLTKLCVDESGLPSTISTTWNWDELGTTGANTLDACNLFDTDGDGNINYAVCVTTTGKPATLQTVTTYSCGDDKIDRCTSPATPISNGSTSCTVSQQNTDPFTAGDDYPADTQGACTVSIAAVGGTTAKLIDVCSYPSAQPNSDPSDCVIIQPKAGKVEVRKNLVPSTDSGLFNLQIDGTTKAANVGNNGTTGEVVVSEGNHSVGETAGTSTNLSGYTSSIECRNLNGTGTVVASGSGTTLAAVPVADGSDIVCIITNKASGSITITKDAIPNSAQDFSFTATGSGTSNFSLDDDSDATLSNSRTFSGLVAGSYTFTESATSGWDFDSITCSQGASVTKDGASVTITLSAGQNVTCGFTNRQRGNIVVHKTTNPANDPTGFQISASGTGSISGTATRTLTTAQDVTYDVGQGTYAVSEQVPDGWQQDSNTCSNLVINGNTPLVNGVPTLTCTIVNTKLAKLKIIKDAVPNGPQDFTFTTSGAGLTGFLLDDDTDATLPNQQQFTNLVPGNYTVAEATQTGWDLTGLSCTGSATNSRTDNTLNITLGAGEDATCTFTNTQRGSILGIKFNDLNGNGVFDAGEPTLSGWTIQLWSDGNMLGEQVTDENGAYSFTNIISGLYNLIEVMQTGWVQTLAPSPVTLDPGETDSANNFGNFQNGSISGYKFNDVNGNGTYDNEPKLSGWVITLYNDNDDADTLLNNQVAQTTTDVNGNYTFTNVARGTYNVCETQQTGWTQTYPASGACHLVVIDQSGEQNTANFGNQGRGTITVIKNVDTDGDGDVDVTGATDWTWDIDASGNYATGSTQNVAAGTYAVSEDQKADYHVTASSCTGEATPETPSEQQTVTVAAGEAVTCTFTNTHNTGTITVRKELNPTTDAGLFDLYVGETVVKENASHGQSGSLTVPTGSYDVAELAGDNTDLADYSSSYVCMNGRQQIVASEGTTSSTSFAVTSGDNITCTFTNVRYGHIIVTKQTLPDGSTQTFGFTAGYNQTGFSLSDGQSNNSGNLLPGTYGVSENAQTGWDLTDATCSDESDPSAIALSAGETVTCTFTNTQRATVRVTKYNDLNRNQAFDAGEPTLEGWAMHLTDTSGETPVTQDQNTDATGVASFTNVDSRDFYALTETQQPENGWSLSDIDCNGVEGSRDGDAFFFAASAGQTVDCFVGNYHTVVLNLDKTNNRPAPTVTGDTVTYSLLVSVPETSGTSFDTTVTDLPPAGFTYVKGSWTAVLTHKDGSTQDLKAANITTEPTYGSPGTWFVGTMLPGDTVLLTYQTLIQNSVDGGTYPDNAFAVGCGLPGQPTCPDIELALSNQTINPDDPFVATQVTVLEPQVLGASTTRTILVNTGTETKLIQLFASLLILTALGLALKTSYSAKGAQR